MKDQANINSCEEMDKLAQTFLNIKDWGFHESVRISETKFPKIIYDSQWCRLKFVWDGWEMYGGYTISIYYGRSHAPDNKPSITWNGEECFCWHDIDNALNFLDGLSPQESVDQMRVHHRWPHVMEQFRQSELGKSLTGTRRQPEWLTRMHAAVWGHYKIHIFELFDLRRPDLWEKYRQFMKELYDIKGRSPNIKPSLDKVC